MYALRDVDAICQVSAGTGHKRKRNHELLPMVRKENDRNAHVRRLRIWEWRMER